MCIRDSSIATSVDRPNYSSSLSKSKVLSTYASVSVGYNSIAYLDASYRFDWGSTANPDSNRIETWGLSGSLILSELIDSADITFAKLRAKGLARAMASTKQAKAADIYNFGFSAAAANQIGDGVAFFSNAH